MQTFTMELFIDRLKLSSAELFPSSHKNNLPFGSPFLNGSKILKTKTLEKNQKVPQTPLLCWCFKMLVWYMRIQFSMMWFLSHEEWEFSDYSFTGDSFNACCYVVNVLYCKQWNDTKYVQKIFKNVIRSFFFIEMTFFSEYTILFSDK